MFVKKDERGGVTFVEINGLDDELYARFDPVVENVEDGLLCQDDAEQIGRLLEPNSSAGLMVFENSWASRFADAVTASGGSVVLNERIPRSVVEQMQAEAQRRAA